MTTYLKFPSEVECAESFAPYMHTDENGDSHYPSYIGTSAVDVVGVIYKPTGEMLTSEDGSEYPAMAPIDGYHVNLSGDCPDDMLPFAIEVGNPVRVFA